MPAVDGIVLDIQSFGREAILRIRELELHVGEIAKEALEPLRAGGCIPSRWWRLGSIRPTGDIQG